jgi:deazaflavin-dependent oxidoreductase (nitroreductase family)
MKARRFVWRLFNLGPRLAYAIGLGPFVGKSVLLLTTRGRKTGLPRVTPLVYEQQGDTIIVASARGPSADWLRNIQTDPRVRVRAAEREYQGMAEVVLDSDRIADYLQRQFNRNPTAFAVILRAEGVPTPPSRADLIRLAPRRPMVTVRKVDDGALSSR